MRFNDENDRSNVTDQDIFEPYNGNGLHDPDDADAELQWRMTVERLGHQARRWVSEHPFAALSAAIVAGFAVGRVVRR